MQCYEEKLRKKQGLWACGSLDRESTGIAKGSMLIAATRLMSTISPHRTTSADPCSPVDTLDGYEVD